MTALQRQVKQAQRRLWLNRWLRLWGRMLCLVTAVWLVGWLADRLLGFHWPIGLTLGAAVGVSLAGSLLWLILTRDQPMAAATALDEAAGLRERVSTGLGLRENPSDPFEAAVLADAEKSVAGLTPRKFLPVRWSGSLSLGGIMIAVALLSLLLDKHDLLGRDAAAARDQAHAAERLLVKAAIAKPISALQEVAARNPDLNMTDDLQRLEKPSNPNADADFRRREVLKQLNRMQDSLQKKAGAERFKAMEETKKRLRQLGQPSDPRNELSKLMERMSSGDFQGAQEEIKKLQERLAQRAHEGKPDPKQIEAMQKQLKSLAEKLEKAAQDKESERELKNAGLSAADAKRVLDSLSKKDPKQLEKLAKELAERLKSQGMTEQQMQEMLKKIQQRQKACKQCQGMGKKMGDAGKAMEEGAIKQAAEQLGEAGKMLNEMEQMEQALNDLESQMAQLDEAADDLGDFDPNKDDLACKQCDGTGYLPDGSPCPNCNGTGQQQGRGRGRGAGPRDRDDSAATSTVNKKAKTKQGRGGSTIGQQFVKGKQLKGESRVGSSDASGAGEIDVTDTLNRDRIPRLYRKSVKRFFDRVEETPKPAEQQGEKANKEQ
jgi:hypothetical protein